MFFSLNTLQRTGNIAWEGVSEQIQIIRLVLRNYFKILPLNDLFNGSLGAHVGDRTNWLWSQTRGRREHWLHWSWHTLYLSLDLSQSFSIFLSLFRLYSLLLLELSALLFDLKHCHESVWTQYFWSYHTTVPYFTTGN